MRVDVDEAGLDLRDAVRIGRALGFGEQRVALEVGLEHDGDQACGAVRGFLREAADAPARRQGHCAVLGRELAADHLEQGRLAGAIAPDQADARPGRDLHGTLVDQKASGEADREVARTNADRPGGAALRRLAGTWVAKALFVLLILSFFVSNCAYQASNIVGAASGAAVLFGDQRALYCIIISAAALALVLSGSIKYISNVLTVVVF